ncbi:MAG TPA: hypothetical protein VGV08_09730, partial [Casimicrobiaceae bacterium]|nr:hypothetical protein [Casimicrobiaceae bacterium]
MDLELALAFSAYAQRAFTAEPALRGEIDAMLARRFDWPAATQVLDAVVASGDAASLARALRRLRRRAFLHTLARDLTGRAPFEEVVATMSTLA